MRRAKRRLEPDPRLLAGHFARHGTRFAHPEVRLDLSDYKTNVALYPTFQEYFRTPYAALAGGMGAETTHSSCRRGPRRSSATSHRERDCALFRYQTFRAGDACPRGRGGHSRLPSLNDNVNRNSPDASSRRKEGDDHGQAGALHVESRDPAAFR